MRVHTRTQPDGAGTDEPGDERAPRNVGNARAEPIGGSDLAEQQQLLERQQARVLAAADRLERQPDPLLRRGLVQELRTQETLRLGLAEGLDRLKEQARRDFELARTRAWLDGVEADRARSVHGTEREQLLAAIRAKLRREA